METPPKLSFACPMPWQAMSGDERRRFCAQCGHHVENLSLLSSGQRRALLDRAKHERVCGTYLVRLSGEMVTPDRPLTEPESTRVRQFGVAALSAGALALAAGCTNPASQATAHAAAATETNAPVVSAAPATNVPAMPTTQTAPANPDEEIILLAMGIIATERPQPPRNAPPSKR